MFAIDFLETGGLIRWDTELAHEPVHRLLDLRNQAKELGVPEPYELCGQEVLVQGLGMGSGRRAHFDLRIEWPGVRLGLAYRETERRENANFYLNITGEACVLYGALKTRNLVHNILEELGGDLRDEWVKRIDLCLDLPDVDIKAWMAPAFQQGHFKCSSREWGSFGGKLGSHGIVIPSKTCRVSIYDKAKETYSKKPELYQLAMQQRWGGRKLHSATRIEYQIRKAWLDNWGLRSADSVLLALPAIVHWLTETDRRPVFCLTDGPVDRKNQHQSRVELHPEWARVVATMRHLAGAPTEPLQRIERGKITAKRAIKSAIGYLTSAAAQKGASLATVDDAAKFLVELAEENEISDVDVELSYLRKAEVRGTRKEPSEFPFGKNADGGAA